MMNIVRPNLSIEVANQITCFMAIELSKTSWVVGMLTPLSNKISLRSIPCGAVEKLMAIVDQTTNRVMQTTGGPVQVVSCYRLDTMAFGYIAFSPRTALSTTSLMQRACW